jgi:hypothetical protein
MVSQGNKTKGRTPIIEVLEKACQFSLFKEVNPMSIWAVLFKKRALFERISER